MSDEQRFARSEHPPWTQHVLKKETKLTLQGVCGIRLRKAKASIIHPFQWSIRDHACYQCARILGRPL